jgi:chromosome segregation ATPase
MKKLILSAVLLPLCVWGKTDVMQQLDRLKENQENSQHNLEQYEGNLKVVEKNLEEVNKAIEQLKGYKTQVKKSKKSVAESEKVIDTTVADIKKEVDKEQKSIQEEEAKMAEVEKIIQRLKTNLEQRQKNLATYKARTDELLTMKSSMGDREKSVNDLDLALDGKYQQAVAQQKEWTDKQKGYNEEIGKWKKYRSESEQMHKNFQRLKD